MLLLDKGSTVVFAGDSVTDADRDRTALPGGWGFGQGYVNHIHNLLTALYPDKEIMTVNSGISGDDIVLLQERWHKDVIDFQPEYVSVMIGVNDVWRHFDGRFRKAPTHDVAEFERRYDEILQDLEEQDSALKKIIIVSPVMFESRTDEPMRAMLDEFNRACQAVAQRHHALYIDMQKDIDAYLQVQHSCIVSPDRVHPNERGAMLMAHSWLRAVGFEWERDGYDF